MDVGILVGKKYNQIKLKFTYKIHIEVFRYYNDQHRQSGKTAIAFFFSSLISLIVGYLDFDYSIYAGGKN